MSKQSPRTFTPGAESVNKWKIPHYYRRSSAASSLQSNGSDNGNGSTPSTPGVNLMSSPKKVLMEESKKGKKRPVYRSRKNKNGEMVFVNYTVQDSASEESITAASTPDLSAGASPVVSSKKKSSRSRMLKIFGSSKAPPAAGSGSNLMACAENEVMCDPYSSETVSATAPAKRSYGSFLKYGKFHGPLTHNRRSESAPSLISEEVVPKSTHSPNLVKPALIGRFVGGSPRKVNYLGGGNLKQESVESPTDYRSLNADKNDPSEIESYPYDQTIPSESAIGAKKYTDENDASIAFSRMFTRKRANTGGSMSSLLSLSHNVQEQLQSTTSVPTLRKNMSATSISSVSYRSPIRTASPARPRSGTRGSYTHGNSVHIRAESQDTGNFVLAGTESFLDSQVVNRTGNGTKNRRKQESISESHRLYSSSASNSTILNSNNNQNVVTPSSSSLVTPPPFTSGYTIPSNTSASSTPSFMDLTHTSQGGSFGNLLNSMSGTNAAGNPSNFNVSQPILDRDSSSEILFEDSDAPTPVDHLPALRGMSRTLETNVEEEIEEVVPSQVQNKITNVTDRELKAKGIQNRPNVDSLDFFLPHGSSTSSSQGGSILTKSTSSVSDNILIGRWQDQGCYSLTDAGAGGVGIKGQNCEKVICNPSSRLSDVPVDHMNYKVLGNEKVLNVNHKLDEQSQTNVEFDFESSNSFFSEQRKISPEGSNSSGQAGINICTSTNGQNSAVTSVANFSPGTTATISVEEITNSGLYHRNFDRLNNHANSLPHSASIPAQQSNLYSMGQWKAINSDLDAITDSLGISDEMTDISYMCHPSRG